MRRLVALLCAAACRGWCHWWLLRSVAPPVTRGSRIRSATPRRSFRSSRPAARTRRWISISAPPPDWQPLKTDIPTHVGSEGMAPQAKSEVPATPMGVFSLDSAFGTAPNPGGGLPYTQVGPNHWWSGDDHSPTFNSMQVCQKSQCPFSTAASENLDIPQYKHAVVMGVNKNKVPGGGPRSSFTPLTAGPPRVVSRSTTPRWCKSCAGFGPARSSLSRSSPWVSTVISSTGLQRVASHSSHSGRAAG